MHLKDRKCVKNLNKSHKFNLWESCGKQQCFQPWFKRSHSLHQTSVTQVRSIETKCWIMKIHSLCRWRGGEVCESTKLFWSFRGELSCSQIYSFIIYTMFLSLHVLWRPPCYRCSNVWLLARGDQRALGHWRSGHQLLQFYWIWLQLLFPLKVFCGLHPPPPPHSIFREVRR